MAILPTKLSMLQAQQMRLQYRSLYSCIYSAEKALLEMILDHRHFEPDHYNQAVDEARDMLTHIRSVLDYCIKLEDNAVDAIRLHQRRLKNELPPVSASNALNEIQGERRSDL